MTSYILLSISVILFSSQFVFNQVFEREEGSSFGSSMLFSLYSSVFGFAVLFVISGFRLNFSMVSLLYAVLYAAVSIAYSVASVKSFGTVNRSAYSIFAMLGGMLLPSVCGIVLFNEELTFFKLLCYVAVAGALIATIDFKAGNGGAGWYLGVFVRNGLVGGISVLHQKSVSAVDSFSFLCLARIAAVAGSLLICGLKKQPLKRIGRKSLWCTLLFAAVNGIGNLFVLMSLRHLPASVQYPVVTGGVMIASLLIDVIKREKLSVKNVVGTAVAFAASLMLAF